MAEGARELRYIEVQRRLDPVNSLGATLISLLMLVATWGRWHDFAIIAGSQLLVVPFNVWVTRRLLVRMGVRRGELLRAAVNMTATVLLCHVAHWPLPVWLWLPFVALAFDHLHGRVSWSVLLTIIAVMDVVALLDHVPWVYPLSFTLFSLFCAGMSAVRFGVIREMLVESETRGAELAHANSELRAAHAALEEENAARVKSEAIARRMAHEAGRAEMAAGVIHNIRNALNAFTLTSGILDVHARAYKGPQLREARRLLEEWDGDHAAALASDPRGRAILERLDRLADDWVDEARELLARSDGLRRASDHIAAVVAKQQEYAKPAAARELCLPSDIVRDAAFLAGSSPRKIDVTERHECNGPILLDRHRVLQIVTNLIRNAEESVAATGRADARVEVSTSLAAGHLRIAVSDDGLGLGPRAMAKLFEYGFTTKDHGHGFGLHSCKLLADEMGGTLRCASEGEGRGATFTLEIPLERRERAPPRAVDTSAPAMVL